MDSTCNMNETKTINTSITPISELSPSIMSPTLDVGMTPDDKLKDPDWGETPLRVKRTKFMIPKKVTDLYN